MQGFYPIGSEAISDLPDTLIVGEEVDLWFARSLSVTWSVGYLDTTWKVPFVRTEVRDE